MANEKEIREFGLNSAGSIPTKVIKSCKRSTTGSLVFTSDSSSDSEEERVSRKRTVENLESFNTTRSKVIKMTSENTSLDSLQSVIKVTPLRPVCSVYMVCYGQDEANDTVAPPHIELLKEPVPGLEVDVNEKLIPQSSNLQYRQNGLRIRRELEKYIFDTRYKTVWHSPTTDINGKPIELSVPFTVNVADIFSSFTSPSIPEDIKQKTYNFAVERAEKLVEFRRIFSMNNPNFGCRSSPHVNIPAESCIVSTGSVDMASTP